MVKLLALAGMKAVFKWREIVIFVRTRGSVQAANVGQI